MEKATVSDEIEKFADEVRVNIERLGQSAELHAQTRAWIETANKLRYSYNFRWMGRPIIQYPQDIMAVQEIIWNYQPDLVIETGIAHGGSIILWASLLELIGGPGRVVGVDIDIRAHNRAAIEAHPMFKRITLIQGSSIEESVVAEIRSIATGAKRPLVLLDSNHTHDHVLAELRLYSPFVRKDSYLVAFDTIIENLPPDSWPDRPWTRGNNPMTAVDAFLKENPRFVIDTTIDDKLQISVAPRGYLRCVRDP
jgi:cephalosporin hydroxylase